MRYLFEHKRRLIAVAGDLCLAAGAYYLAHLIRFEGEIPSNFMGLLLNTLPLLLLIRAVCFVALGLYRGVWAYASITDLLAIVKGVTAGSGVFAVLLLLFGVRGFSRGILVLDWLLVIFFVGGARLSLRLWRTARTTRRATGKPVLVIGAGDAGEMVLRELSTIPD
jgi:UDP-GlcNAc:undecaprenyl-phosphate/decaprenyl-phosphate GlcNAc-1-phosphate transferase